MSDLTARETPVDLSPSSTLSALYNDSSDLNFTSTSGTHKGRHFSDYYACASQPWDDET